MDASVAVKWFAGEQDSDLATALVGMPGLIAPELVLAEVGNAIWKMQRRGQIERPAERFVELGRLFERLEPIAPLVNRALALAIRLDHPIYDCLYLALAEREDMVVVTADERLLSVCRAKGLDHQVRTLQEATA